MVRPAHGTWVWPVVGDSAVVRPFEAPATRYSAGHRGIDLAADPNTVVVAPEAGVVSFAGTVVDRPVLSITSDGGLVSSIEPVTATVQAGDAVAAGDVVGAVASGGHCGTTCAHFGVRLYGEYVNPLVLLQSLPRAVLLPIGP
ncbi:murein hydrolase activator EnvC family protein [Mycetocola zhadangensis]|uniref:murein hydrolase activator EnvC family protein n=1 Tax=Mycetocola zhadangensis TaxID=1164595 RepID=UPI003A4D759E